MRNNSTNSSTKVDSYRLPVGRVAKKRADGSFVCAGVPLAHMPADSPAKSQIITASADEVQQLKAACVPLRAIEVEDASTPVQVAENAPAVVLVTDRGDRATQSGTSPPKMKIHVFRSLTDTDGRAVERTWPQVWAALTGKEYPSKGACPMFSPGVFDGPIKDRAPFEFWFVVGEHDAGTVSLDEARQRAEAADLRCGFYTSASHTPDAPRWRVVCPLREPIDAKTYSCLVSTLNGILGGCLARESVDLSRRWFYGRVEGAPFESVFVQGGHDLAALDLLGVVEAVPVAGIAAPAEGADYVVSGEIASRSPEEQRQAADKVKKLMRIAFGGRALDDRGDWQRFAAGAKYESGNDPEVEQLFVDLSSEWAGDPTKTPTELADYARKTWESSGNRDGGQLVTMGTLVELARRADKCATDRVLQLERAQPNADGLEDLSAMRRPPAGDNAEFEAIMAEIKAASWSKGASTDAPKVDVFAFVESTLERTAKASLPTLKSDAVLKALQAFGKSHGQDSFSLKSLREDFRKWQSASDVAAATHHSYAEDFVRHLTERSGERPVAAEGQIFVYQGGLWIGREPHTFEGEIAARYDGRENCSRKNDYAAIAQHAMTLVNDPSEAFFEGAPMGVAAGGFFYRLADNGELVREPLGPQHRARAQLPVEPVEGPMPTFRKFLRETFKSAHPIHGAADEQEQAALLQEVMGAAIMGLMARSQKAVLFLGESRAGKGTVQKVLEEMMPSTFKSAVSPFKWGQEYNVAHLAGRRLNTVGELPGDAYIPAADFKTVTGGDTLTGRHPTHRPFSFRNTAAHVFSSNHLLNTSDVSEGFFSRWVILYFANGRALGAGEVDTGLDRRIIDEELGQVVAWAMQGAVRLAKRLAARQDFSLSRLHHEWLNRWRRRASSVLEFLHDADACGLGEGEPVARVEVYTAYRNWAFSHDRKAIPRSKFFDELESGAVRALGITVLPRTATERERVLGVRLRGSTDDVGMEKS